MTYSKSLGAMAAALFMNLSTVAVSHGVVTIDWRTIGDAGNIGDVQTGGTFGSVASAYRISTYEVTNAQYVEFLNSKDATGANTLLLYSNQMTSNTPSGGINFTAGNANGSKYSVKPDRGNNPVTFVSFYDSIRFTNWLHNGQGGGDTESGAYVLTGGTPTPSNANSITRDVNATIFLPSENEWYKAAYYKGGGTNAGYWDYATQSDTLPVSDQPPGAFATNSANYFNNDGNAGNGINDGYAVTGSPTLDPNVNHLSDVGAYGASLSAYGTLDQNGNVFEWNESLVGSDRIVRGGSWNTSDSGLAASDSSLVGPTADLGFIGFRVAALVPEPAGLMLCVLTGRALLRGKRRGSSGKN